MRTPCWVVLISAEVAILLINVPAILVLSWVFVDWTQVLTAIGGIPAVNGWLGGLVPLLLLNDVLVGIVLDVEFLWLHDGPRDGSLIKLILCDFVDLSLCFGSPLVLLQVLLPIVG